MKKLLIVSGVLLIVVTGVLGAGLATFDANHSRDTIAQILSETIGQTVSFSGPIRPGLSANGLTLELAGASVLNPSWASRPDLARIGKFRLGIAFLPLLHGQMVIQELTLSDVDILLETNADHLANWASLPQMTDSGTSPARTESVTKTQAAAKKVTVHIESLIMNNGCISMRDQDGKITTVKADRLIFKQHNELATLDFSGAYNALSITLKLTTNGNDPSPNKVRPFDIDLAFANLHLKTDGKVSLTEKQALLDHYTFSAGFSSVTGALAIDWAGSHPALTGNLNSDHLALADLRLESSPESGDRNSTTTENETVVPVASPVRLLNDTPLGLEKLKSVDMKMDVAVGILDLGNVALDHVEAKLAVKDGDLLLLPFTAYLGAGKLTGQAHINGVASPPALGLALNGTDVNLSDILHVGKMESFLSGKVDLQTNLASSGESPHAIASNLNGTLSIVGAGGDIVTRTSDRVSSGIDALLGGDPKGEQNLNCLVAQFTIANGLIKDNGILLDTVAATVAGGGSVDLRGETMDLLFRAKPKSIDTAGLLPPLHVGGTFLNPETSVSTVAVVETIAGLVLGEGREANDPIPDVVVQQGQNACVAALNHPAAEATASAQQPRKQGLVQKLGGQASQILKGLFGQ